MLEPLTDLSPWRIAPMAVIPLLFVAAATAGAATRGPALGAWRLARLATIGAVGASLVSLAWLAASGPALVRGPALLPLGDTALHASLRSDVPGVLMLLLVSALGWVIVRYSQTYLQGEAGQARYVRNLMATLAAVCVLVMANNLLLLALAWIATSLALHGLLTFFSRRPQALIAAHKKFIASRIADLCLLSAVALVGVQLGTLEIDRAADIVLAMNQVPVALQLAALLFAASALLKCAQLPVHGWLIQVMEAPTPVSALLHAGVVNLGGFLLIRIGPLVNQVDAAQALLVVVGSVTAVAAALVTLTRVSIKVSLAWSTCAQMGFMLMQCGLGLYDLALLHLVAHSLYKAHAFLGAGGAVEHNRLRQMTPPPVATPAVFGLLGAAAGAVVVATAGVIWGLHASVNPALWAVGGILSMALAPLLAAGVLRRDAMQALAALAAAFSIAMSYFGLHTLFAWMLGAAAFGPSPGTLLIAWALGCFALLFVLQSMVRAQPGGALAQRLYPWLFAGFYVDDVFTRLTFRIWPARVPGQTRSRPAN